MADLEDLEKRHSDFVTFTTNELLRVEARSLAQGLVMALIARQLRTLNPESLNRIIATLRDYERQTTEEISAELSAIVKQIASPTVLPPKGSLLRQPPT